MPVTDFPLDDLTGWTDEALADELEAVTAALDEVTAAVKARTDDQSAPARMMDLQRRQAQLQGAILRRAYTGPVLAMRPDFWALVMLVFNYSRTYAGVALEPEQLAAELSAVASRGLLSVVFPEGLQAGCERLCAMLQAVQQADNRGVFWPGPAVGGHN